MFHSSWRAGSFRFRVSLGIFLSIVPLLLSAVVIYVSLDRLVIAEFQDVALRQRSQMAPLQQLQLRLHESGSAIELYVEEAGAVDVERYRATRAQIEAGFAAVLEAFAAEHEAAVVVERARADWTAADTVAMRILGSVWIDRGREGAEATRQFDAAIASATDRLQAVYDRVNRDIDRDHQLAQRAYDRAQLLTIVAAAASLLVMFAGTVVLGRFLLVSVDRLVEGAERFANGDRDYRIDVQVPPELHRVAEEFNHMIVRIRDSEEALAALARKDGLTGLLNRRAFDEIVPQWMQAAGGRGEELALLMIDVDHFKRVNDAFGHAGGDEVLRGVAAALAAAVRDTDRVFRVGGEEFAVLLRDSGFSPAAAQAERLRAAIAGRTLAVEQRHVRVTISVGVAVSRTATDPERLIRSADAALYVAKQQGRDRVVMEAA